MGIVDPVISIVVNASSGGTITYQDDLYDYRYYRVVSGGSSDDTVSCIVNGVPVTISGGTWIDVGVYSLQVISGNVVLIGQKSARKLFGDNVHPYNIEQPPYNV
jgi:hypothetical protein